MSIIKTPFDAGKEFRSFFEFSLGNAEQIVIKAVVPVNVLLKHIETVLVEGQIKLETLVGGTEGGTYSVTVPIFNRNNMAIRPMPLYTTQVSLTSGGTHTGGVILDVLLNRTSAGATAIATVGTMFSDERGVAPNTYYFKITAQAAAIGVFKIRWEELP